jgi:hypothetical protein
MREKIKKIFPYIMILTILLGVGLFGSAEKVWAQTPGVSQCFNSNGNAIDTNTVSSKELCEFNNGKDATGGLTGRTWHGYTAPPASQLTGTCKVEKADGSGYDTVTTTPDDCTQRGGTWSNATTPATTGQSEFDTYVKDHGCGFGAPGLGGSNSSIFPGCLISGSYYLFYVIPAFLLWAAAYFFNVLIAITLGSKLISDPAFIPAAWGVVRDLSNIFFILILLYIAVKIILGLGGSDVKKMIVTVIITALLINFSMFFTKVVIDSSNILALVFYNKLTPPVAQDGKPIPYDPATADRTDKDVAGSMVNSFDPTKLLSKDFFDNAGTLGVFPGQKPLQQPVSYSIIIGVTILAGVLMLFAAYCFFVAGLSFVGRLIELWILIIFSPFAFMSASVPKLASYEYLGWEAWFKRLLKMSFMAPIFMFFLYFIFLIIQKGNPLASAITSNGSTIAKIILVVLPAMLVLILLLKATKYAKEGSGVFGEMIVKGGKMAAGLVGGVALGAATGGAATLGRATLGRAGAALADSEWAKKREAQGKFASTLIRSGAKSVGSGSFDARAVKIGGKDLAGATGMNLGGAHKGGFIEGRKEQVDKRQKRAQELGVGEDERLKQDLNNVEKDLQDLLRTNSHELEELDKKIKNAREAAADASAASRADPKDATKKADAKKATEKVLDLKLEKKALKSGKGNFTRSADRQRAGEAAVATFTNNTTSGGKSINDLEDRDIPDAHYEIEKENRNRAWAYAGSQQTGWERTKSFLTSGDVYSKAASREAAHKIRMEVKLDSGTKEGSH